MKRLRACGCWPIDKNESVDLHVKEVDGGRDVAYYAGLQSCASPWICPVCSAKIRHRHAEDIANAAMQWIADGRALYTLLLTAPHDRSMTLEQSWNFIRESFRSMLQGRSWQNVKSEFGIEGYVRSTETTHGANGWHPHIHVVLFLRSEIDDDDRKELEGIIYGKWAEFVDADGRGTACRDLFEIYPVKSASDVASYLTKTAGFEDFAAKVDDGKISRLGLEVARSDLKDGRRSGRTPFQLARDFIADPVENAGDLALWLEWETGSKGKRSVEWSRDTIRRADGSPSYQSFKKRFGLDDVDDEQLAEDDVGGARVRTLSDLELTLARVTGRMLRLLEVAESHGSAGVEFYLEFLTMEFEKTGDLSALEELDDLIDRSQLVPRDVGG